MAYKGDLFDLWGEGKPDIAVKNVRSVAQYEQELQQRYKDELKLIKRLQRELCDERTTFAERTLPKVSDFLKQEDTNPQIAKHWLQTLEKNYSDSLNISEKTVDKFYNAIQDDKVCETRKIDFKNLELSLKIMADTRQELCDCRNSTLRKIFYTDTVSISDLWAERYIVQLRDRHLDFVSELGEPMKNDERKLLWLFFVENCYKELVRLPLELCRNFCRDAQSKKLEIIDNLIRAGLKSDERINELLAFRAKENRDFNREFEKTLREGV